ncbi:hypothetical protein Fmac_017995 [Flemingia macrophylla]|uniref:Uncharacterized protein n=1 Tax=Flemingia macrophylla TaxID=520843 RepID=A0ABD1M3Q2_9FABA
MSVIPNVSDTISEIEKRLSSLDGLRHKKSTEKIEHHLSLIKNECSDLAKLNLSDPDTGEWVSKLYDLFYVVDDLCADVAGLKKVSLFSACSYKTLLQLKQIEKRLQEMSFTMKNVKMLSIPTTEGAETDPVKEAVMEIVNEKEEGVVRAVVTFGLTEGIERDDQVRSWFGGAVIRIRWRNLVYVDYYVRQISEKTKEKGFLVILYNFRDENRNVWFEFAMKLKEAAATTSCGVLLVTTQELAAARLVGSSFQPTNFRFDWLSPSKSPKGSEFEQFARTIEPLFDMFDNFTQQKGILATLFRRRRPTTKDEVDQLKDELVQDMLLDFHITYNLDTWSQKQCFGYSIFIFFSQRSMKRAKIVSLWMAEGFLKDSEPEEVSGHEIIKKFLDKKIFSEASSREEIEMNSELLDAAPPIVLGIQNVYMKDIGILKRDVRRVSLCSELDVSTTTLRSLSKTNKSVGTFLIDKQRVPNPSQVVLSWLACDAVLSSFKRLRVLALKDLGMKALPASIEDLKSLRYLDLGGNSFEKLPTSVGELQHLQTLLLCHCLHLMELPDNVNHFVSLRHLDLDDCPSLKQMPSALRKLTWFSTLPHFVTSRRNGVGDLLHLNELRGHLKISHLELVKFKESPPSPSHSYLIDKKHLQGLTLRWNDDDEEENSEITLSLLEPPQVLKDLSLFGYRGTHWPGWFSSLNNLVEISLYSSPNCQSLPIDDSVLAKLETIILVNMASLQFITQNHDQKGMQLKRVKIWDCPNLTSWWKPGTQNTSTPTVFSKKTLSELEVVACPKLVGMPLFPFIQGKLVLDRSNMEPLLKTLRYKTDDSHSLSQLESLTIRGCQALNTITGWKHFTSLETLCISNCMGLDIIKSEEWEGLEQVTKMVIENIPDLESLPEGMKYLEDLETLEIKRCPLLKKVPDKVVTEYFIDIVLEDCPALDTLPKSWTKPPKPKLTIRNCPLLKSWIESESKPSKPQEKKASSIIYN